MTEKTLKISEADHESAGQQDDVEDYPEQSAAQSDDVEDYPAGLLASWIILYIILNRPQHSPIMLQVLACLLASFALA